MPLDASIRLNHLEQEVVLNPFQSYFFDGGDPVSSQGTCQDFNLIYKPSYQGHMSAISPHESVSSQSRYQFIYALSSLTLKWGKEHTKVLQAHELLVLEQASPPSRDDNHVFTPSVWGASNCYLDCTKIMLKRRDIMNGAHKQSIEEQEKAKFSFSGATFVRYQCRDWIWYLPLYLKNLCGLGPASLAVMFG